MYDMHTWFLGMYMHSHIHTLWHIQTCSYSGMHMLWDGHPLWRTMLSFISTHTHTHTQCVMYALSLFRDVHPFTHTHPHTHTPSHHAGMCNHSYAHTHSLFPSLSLSLSLSLWHSCMFLIRGCSRCGKDGHSEEKCYPGIHTHTQTYTRCVSCMHYHYSKMCTHWHTHTHTHYLSLWHTYMFVIQICTRCGRDSHSEEQCYATTTVDGYCIRDSDSELEQDSDLDSEQEQDSDMD